VANPRENILVVDDNQDIRNLVTAILENDGYTVSTCDSGAAALAALERSTPSLILLDVMMPQLSGYEVLEKIRANRDKKVSGIPIMMITAKSEIEDIDRALELGATSYIVKPFRAVHLCEKIRDVLNSK